MPRYGGRTKGTPNRASAAKAAEIAASGLTPLDYMVAVMRNERADPMVRLEAARAAAPYCHPRLSAVDVSNSNDGPLIVEIVKFAGDKYGESN